MKKILIVLSGLILLVSCQKETTNDIVQPGTGEKAVSPTDLSIARENKNLEVTTTSVNANSAIWAFANGNISVNGGGNSVVERGFCYSTSPDPTIDDDTVRAGAWAGSFQKQITGLSIGTTYYVKAYGIKNNNDIYYGNELSFTTLTLGLPSAGVGTVIDIDGNEYTTIRLGTQVWMVENLKTTRFRDGSAIPNITDNATWLSAGSAAYCDYNNNPALGNEYGRLYNTYAITDARGLAPTGWHVPSFGEWITLLNYLGGGGIAAGRMKEAGLVHWLAPNTGADNTSGLTVLGAGGRNFGNFTGLQTRSVFGTSSSSSTTFSALILSNVSSSYSFSFGGCSPPYCTSFGVSVRCVMD